MDIKPYFVIELPQGYLKRFDTVEGFIVTSSRSNAARYPSRPDAEMAARNDCLLPYMPTVTQVYPTSYPANTYAVHERRVNKHGTVKWNNGEYQTNQVNGSKVYLCVSRYKDLLGMYIFEGNDEKQKYIIFHKVLTKDKPCEV